MATGFDLEVISHGPKQLKVLPISAHVLKYTEQFVYTSKIPNINTPIAYFESDPIDAWKNIQLIDQTHTIPSNCEDFIEATGASWFKVASTSFVLPYKYVAITNHVIIDEYGKEKPLFFKHVLPTGTEEAHVYVYENGEESVIETGLLIDYEHGCIWTNYQNYFNPDTGAYRFYFVSTPGNHELLNNIPAIGIAGWEDVDLRTCLEDGSPNPDYGKVIGLSYTMEEVNGGFRFDLTGHEGTSAADYCDDGPLAHQDRNLTDGMGKGNYYVKPLGDNNLKVLLPSGKTPEDPWHVKITNGYFYELLLGRMRKYWVPEFDYQPFSPAKPYIFSPYRKMLWVNRNILAATRKHIAIDPDQSMHMMVYVYNRDKELVHLYTTDTTQHDHEFVSTIKKVEDSDGYKKEIVSSTSIKQDADPNNPPIVSWDNRNGFIYFGRELDPGHTFYCSFFYEAKDYEYTTLTLNPLQNREALVHMWVWYCVPDTHKHDKSIHLLGVNEEGIIVSCSQSLGRTYPNLQLTHQDQTFNHSTVIGMSYQSMTNPNNFKNIFCVPYINDYQYYILAEAVVMDIGDEEEALVFDVRREGAKIQDNYFEDAIRANPRILQSYLGYGDEGQTVPENNVALISAPINLLNEYGGVLSRERGESLLKKYLPAAKKGVIDWVWTYPDINGWCPIDKWDMGGYSKYYIALNFTWEGPSLEYHLYKKEVFNASWFQTGEHEDDGTPVIREPIAILNTGEERLDKLTYDDLDVKPGETYYYGVQVVENGIKLPIKYTFAVSVREEDE